MSEFGNPELQHWQSRCDDLSVANETLREERDLHKEENVRLKAELDIAKSTISRIQVAMSQGQEL